MSSMSYTDGLGRPAYLPTSSDKDKARAIGCYKTRDGRFHLSCQSAATLSPGKSLFLAVIAFGFFLYVLSSGPDSSVHRRVAQLEQAMGAKLSWVLKHQKHIRQHLIGGKGDGGGGGGGGTSGGVMVTPGALHPDGRRHLMTPIDGVSKLAEALAPNTHIATFDDHYLCGEQDITEEEVIRKTIALAAVTWRAPLSLRNSMESWRRGGLLDIVDERMLFINSPTDEDYAIAAEYEFDVYITEERGGNIMAGPSLAYLVGNTTADYVLFMEKDFVLSADKATMMREMYTGIQHLAKGVDVYRLRGKTDHPAEGMPDCCAAKADPPNCPFNSQWKSAGFFGDHMNWLFIFCQENLLEAANGRVAYCTQEPNAPDSYCFTSGETNWSNNPVLFPRTWFNDHIREIAFKDWERNNMFEYYVTIDWLAWRPPANVCVSMQGIFTHFEIDQ